MDGRVKGVDDARRRPSLTSKRARSFQTRGSMGCGAAEEKEFLEEEGKTFKSRFIRTAATSIFFVVRDCQE